MKLGFIARFQAAAIQQVRGLEIAGLIRRRGSEAVAELCRSRGLGEAKIYDSIGEMAKHVDAIAIYVPKYARIEVMEQVAATVKAGAKLRGLIVEAARPQHEGSAAPGRAGARGEALHRILRESDLHEGDPHPA